MSTIIDTLLIEIEAGGADAQLLRLDRHLGRVGDQAVTTEGKTRRLSTANRGLANAAASVDRALLGQLRQLVALGGAYLGIVTAARQVAGAIRIWSQFEFTMSSVQAVTRATKDEMTSMTAEAKRLGEATIFSASEAGSAMDYLGRAGFRASEIVGAMPGLLDLAAAGKLGLAEASNIAAQAIRGFNLEAGESNRVADVLAAAAANANTDVAMMGEGMSYVAPLAAALGIEIEMAAAAIGVLSDAGIQGSMAGTSLRRILSELADPTAEAQKELARLGLTAAEVNPETNLLSDIIQRLADAGLDAAAAMSIFQDRGGPAILALTSKADRLRELNALLEDSEGAADRMAATMMDTLVGAADELESTIESLKIEFGQGMNPALREAALELTAFFRTGQDEARSFGRSVGQALVAVVEIFLFLMRHVDLVKAGLFGLVAAFAVLKFGPLIAGALAYAKAFVALAAAEGLATVATAELSLAWTRLTAVMATNPIGLVALVLGALVGALVLAKSRHEDAEQAADRYYDRLRYGTPEIEAEVRAHAELVDRLEAELRVRRELASTGAAAEEKLAALRPVLEAMEAALDAGDVAAYREAVVEAERLGIAFQSLQEGAVLQRVRLEVRALETDAARTARGIEESGASIRSVYQAMQADAEGTLRAEVTLRLEQRAALADLEAQAASAQVAIANMMAAGGEGEIFFRALRRLQGEVRQLASDAARARRELAGTEERIARQVVPGVQNRLGELFRRGDMEAWEDLLRSLPTDIYERIFPTEPLEDIVGLYREARQRLDDYAKSQEDARRKSELETEEVRKKREKYVELNREIELQIAAQRAATAAYELGVLAGQEAVEAAEAEAAARSATKDLLAEDAVRLRERIRLLDEEARKTRGAEAIAVLSELVAAQERLTQARGDGLGALEAARRENAALELILEKQTGTAEENRAAIERLVRQWLEGQAAFEFDERKAGLDRAAAQVNALAEAWTRGREEVVRLQAEQAIANRLHQEAASAIDTERLALEERIATESRLRAVVAAQQSVDAIRRQVEEMRVLAQIRREDFATEEAYQRAIERGNEAKELRARLLEIENQRIAAEVALKSRAWKSEDDYQRALAETNEQFAAMTAEAQILLAVRSQLARQDEQVLDALKTAQQAWSTMIESMQRDLAGAFNAALEDGLESFEDFFDRVLDLARSFVADWLAYWTISGGKTLWESMALGRPQGRSDASGIVVDAGSAALTGAIADAAKALTSAGDTTANLFVGGAKSAGSALVSGADIASQTTAVAGAIVSGEFSSAGAASAAAMVTGAQTAGSGWVVSVTQSGGILIEAATAAGAALQTGGTTGGVTGGVVGGSGGVSWAALGYAAVVVGIVGAIGYSLGWWGSKDPATGRATFGGEPGSLAITEAVGENAKLAIRHIREAFELLNDFLKQTDLEITRFADTVVDKTAGVYTVRSGPAAAVLRGASAEELEEAIATLAIRGAEFGDSVSDFVQAVIRGSRALTREQLKAEIELGRMVEGFGRSDAEQRIREIGRSMDVVWDELLRLLADDLEQLAFGLHQTALEEVERFRDARRAITGEEPSIEEQREIQQAQGRIWNAEKALRLATLRGRLALLEADKQIERRRIEFGIHNLRGRALLYDAEIDLGREAMIGLATVVEAGGTILDVQIDALRNLISSLEGLPDIDLSTLRLLGAGRGAQRAEERERIRRELDELRLAAAGVADGALALRRDLLAFHDWIDEARRLGFAEEELAQARRDNLAVLEREFAVRYRAPLGGELGGQAFELVDEYRAAWQEAIEIAREAAAVHGTTFADELARIGGPVAEALGRELEALLVGGLADLIAAGDVAGLRGFLEVLTALAEMDLPPELAAIVDGLDEMAAAVLAAIATIEQAFGGMTFTEGLDVSGVQEWIDRALGLTETQASLREIALEFAAVYAQAEILGASEEELTLLRQAEALAIDDVRQSILQTIQEWTDAALGIGAHQRRLLDARATFTAARDGLADAAQAARDLGHSTQGLATQFDLLDSAEQIAIRQIGIDFVGSLEALGVSLPTEAVYEFAMAEFELARMQAISSAAALAAAGAFDTLSFSLDDLVSWILGASFESSQFAPRMAGGGTGGGGGGGSTTDPLAEARAAIRSQIRDWRDATLDPVTREVVDLTRTFNGLREALLAAGGTTADLIVLEEEFAETRQRILDQALAPLREAREAIRRGPEAKPQENFLALRSQFLAAAAAVRGGDLSRIQEVSDLAVQLRDVGAAYFGTSTGGFRNLRSTIDRELSRLIDEGIDVDLTGIDLDADRNDLLAEIRDEVVRHSGFWTETIATQDSAIDFLRSLDLPLSDVAAILASLQEHGVPLSKLEEIVTVLEGQQVPLGALPAILDAIFDNGFDLAALPQIAAIANQLRTNGIPLTQLSQIMAAFRELEIPLDNVPSLLDQLIDQGFNLDNLPWMLAALWGIEGNTRLVVDRASGTETNTGLTADRAAEIVANTQLVADRASLAIGGEILRGGLALLHAGEVVLTREQSGSLKRLIGLSSGFGPLQLQAQALPRADAIRVVLPPTSPPTPAAERARLDAEQREERLADEIARLNGRLDKLIGVLLADKSSPRRSTTVAGTRSSP